MSYLCVRLNGKNIQSAIKSIGNIWRISQTGSHSSILFLLKILIKLWSGIEDRQNIHPVFGTGYFHCLLGLIGLITYMTTLRTREVGIRKTFGATKRIIVTFCHVRFWFFILISSLVAYPIAYFGIRFWLNSFAEKITVGPAIYIIASIIGLTIGWFSIIYQALKRLHITRQNH